MCGSDFHGTADVVEGILRILFRWEDFQRWIGGQYIRQRHHPEPIFADRNRRQTQQGLQGRQDNRQYGHDADPGW